MTWPEQRQPLDDAGLPGIDRRARTRAIIGTRGQRFIGRRSVRTNAVVSPKPGARRRTRVARAHRRRWRSLRASPRSGNSAWLKPTPPRGRCASFGAWLATAETGSLARPARAARARRDGAVAQVAGRRRLVGRRLLRCPPARAVGVSGRELPSARAGWGGAIVGVRGGNHLDRRLARVGRLEDQGDVRSAKACRSQRKASESGAHSAEVFVFPAIGLGSCQTRQRTPSLCFPGALAAGHHAPLHDVPIGGLCTGRLGVSKRSGAEAGGCSSAAASSRRSSSSLARGSVRDALWWSLLRARCEGSDERRRRRGRLLRASPLESSLGSGTIAGSSRRIASRSLGQVRLERDRSQIQLRVEQRARPAPAPRIRTHRDGRSIDAVVGC